MPRIVDPVTSEEIRNRVSKPGSGRKMVIRENLLRPLTPTARDWLRQWEDDWEAVPVFRPGLWIWGPADTAKTWTALNISTLHPLNPPDTYISKVWDTKRFMVDYQRRQWYERMVLNDRSDSMWDEYTTFENQFERLCWCDILVMDDMYYWDQPSWHTSEIEYMLKQRLDRGLATIMVARDLPPEDSVLHDVLHAKAVMVTTGR